MNDLISPSDYSKHKGVSKSYVSQWLKDFKIPLIDGKLDLEVANKYWAKRPRTKAKKINFEEARTAKMHHEARLSEMNADILAGKLVTTASVVETWERSYSKIKNKLQSMPVKLGPLLAIEEDKSICTAKLKNAISKILNELARESRIPTA